MHLDHFIKHITKMTGPALDFFYFFHYFYFLLLEMVMSTKKKLGSEDSTFLPPFSVYSKFLVILKDFKNALF